MASERPSGKPNAANDEILAGFDRINQRLDSLESQMSTNNQNLMNQLNLITQKVQQIVQNQTSQTYTLRFGPIETPPQQPAVQPSAGQQAPGPAVQNPTFSQSRGITTKPKQEKNDPNHKAIKQEDSEITLVETKRAAPVNEGSSPKKMPRRGLSPYMFSSQDKRAKIKEENPDATFGQIGKLLGERWKSMSDEEKEPYIVKAEADKKRYEAENAS